MDNVQIVKVGGVILDNKERYTEFLSNFSIITTPKILIHGGGTAATSECQKRNLPVKIIQGRRVTDKQSLKIIRRVYTQLNHNLVWRLKKQNVTAVGMTETNNNVLRAKLREDSNTNYGYVGDLDVGGVDLKVLEKLLLKGKIPVFNALTTDQNGTVLNTNADTIASILAQKLAQSYQVDLIFCFEKKGVLKDFENNDSVIKDLSYSQYINMVRKKQISAGMIPKLDCGFKALEKGVKNVTVKNASELLTESGTFLHYG